MVLTLELPIRQSPSVLPVTDALPAYEQRFGALPSWFDEIPLLRRRALARRALAQGVPLAAADHFS